MVVRSDQFKTPPVVRKNNDIHLGNGLELEYDCGCELALCGLVYYEAIHTTCKIHGSRNNNPMPYWHYAHDCPGMEINYGEVAK